MLPIAKRAGRIKWVVEDVTYDRISNGDFSAYTGSVPVPYPGAGAWWDSLSAGWTVVDVGDYNVLRLTSSTGLIVQNMAEDLSGYDDFWAKVEIDSFSGAQDYEVAFGGLGYNQLVYNPSSLLWEASFSRAGVNSSFYFRLNTAGSVDIKSIAFGPRNL